MVQNFTTHDCACGYTGTTEQPKEQRLTALLLQHISAVPVRPQRTTTAAVTYQRLYGDVAMRPDHQPVRCECACTHRSTALLRGTRGTMWEVLFSHTAWYKSTRSFETAYYLRQLCYGQRQRRSHGHWPHGLHIRPSAREGCSSTYPQKMCML